MIRIKTILLFLLLFCFYSSSLLAQNKTIDSLLAILKGAKEDTSKLNSLNILTRQYINIYRHDESKKYADEAMALANRLISSEGKSNPMIKKSAQQGLGLVYHNMGVFYSNQFKYQEALNNYAIATKIREEIGDKHGLAATQSNIGTVYENMSNISEALKYQFAAIKICEEIGEKRVLSNALHNVGRIYLRQSNFPAALQYFLRSLKIREENGDKQGVGNTLGNIGLIYQNQGNYSEALKNHGASLKMCSETGDKRCMANAYLNIGTVYFHQGNYPDAILNYNASLKINEEIGNKQGAVYAMGNIGIIHDIQGRLDEAMNSQVAVLKILEEIRDKLGQARAHTNIGLLYKKTGKYAEALKSYYTVLKLSGEVGDKQGLADAHVNIGNIYESQGNYSEALKNQLESLKILETIGNKYSLVRTHNNIGNIYKEQANALFHEKASFIGIRNKLLEALKEHNEGLKISIELDDKEGQALSYNNIGLSYSMEADAMVLYNVEKNEIKNKFDHALQNLFNAAKINEELKAKYNLSNTYLNIGDIYKKQNDYLRALENYFTSLKTFRETGVNEGIVESCLKIGDTYREQAAKSDTSQSTGKYQEALKYINEGLLLAKGIGMSHSIIDGYSMMAEVFKGMEDYQKAYNYANLQHKMEDSVFSNETTAKVEQLKNLYETEKLLAEGKAKQDKILADQRLVSEKKLAEEKLANEKRLFEQKTLLELSATENQYQYELSIANEKAEQEKIKMEEKLKREQMIAFEKSKAEQTIANNKAEQKRKTELLMLGSGMLVLVLIFAFLFFRQRTLKQRAIERADVVHKMAELELQSLRAQLNPHFMFNSLNAIQELILMEDNERSHVYLSRFSKLIRMLLDNANQPFISLKKELEFLELYLSLEKLRIPDLEYSIKTDPQIDMDKTRLPNMILQPYIENAIWHGLSPKQGDKKLQLIISRQNGAIQYEIEDNGIGRKKGEELRSLYRKEHKSKGMELLTKRFKLLSEEFGSDINTAVTDVMNNGEAGGTKVSITVPGSLSEKIKEVFA